MAIIITAAVSVPFVFFAEFIVTAILNVINQNAIRYAI